MNGKRCEWRDPEKIGVAPQCPNPSDDDSMYCVEHRDYGWGSAHAANRAEGK